MQIPVKNAKGEVEYLIGAQANVRRGCDCADFRYRKPCRIAVYSTL